MIDNKWLLGILVVLLIAVVGVFGYYFGYNTGFERANVDTFEECAAIYPVMESYPERCLTPDGRSFTREVGPLPIETEDLDQGVACTMEAKICPDGSYVGRSGPNCEFAPCPGE